MSSLAVTLGRRMRDLDLETQRRPEDPGPWLELVALARRNRQPLPGWAPTRLGMARLREFWRADPDERAWLRFFAPLTGLRPAPRGRPGRYWGEAGRLRGAGGAAYDGATGLPLTSIRHLDGVPVRLVPVEAVEATLRGGPRGERVDLLEDVGVMPIGDLYIDAVPVTLRRFLEVDGGPARRDPDMAVALTGRLHGVDPRCPAVLVSHAEALAYCRRVGADLPRFYEWRAAAGGVDCTTYPWGEDPPTPRLANYDPIDDRRTSRSLVRLPREADRLGECLTPVGTFPDGVGPFGHLDLAGTVYEWMSAEPRGDLETGPWESIAGGGWLTPRGPGLHSRTSQHRRSEQGYVDVGFRAVLRV